MNSIMVKTLLGVTLALNASNNASNNAQRQQEQQTNSSGNDRDKLWDKLNKSFCENNKPPYSSLHNFCCDNKEMFSDNYQPLFLGAESYSDCQSEFNSLHKMDGDQKFSDLLWGSYGIVNKANEACDVQFGSIFEDATCHELDKIAKLKNESDNYESFEKSCIEVLGEIDSQYQVSFKHLMDFLTPQAKEEKERRKCSDEVNEESGSGKIDMSDTRSGNFFDNIDFVPIGVIAVIAVIAAVIAVSGLAYYCFYCTNGQGANGTNGTNGGQGDANTNPNGKGPNDDDIDNTNKIVIGNNEKAENNIEDTNANGTKNKAVQCDKPTDKGNNENGENTCLTSLFRYCISSGQDGKVDNKDNPDGQDVDANTNTNQIDMDANNDNNDNNVNPNANNDNNVNPNGTNGGQGDANTNPNQIDMDANNDNNDNNVNPNANGTNNVYNENN